MTVRGMMSLLSGLAEGSADQMDRNRASERQDRLEQLRIEEGKRQQGRYDREEAQFARQQEYQDALEAAGAPVTPMKPATMDNVDVGQPGEQPVGMAANSPEQIQQRQLAVMQRFDPKGAAAMQASMLGVQEKTLELADKRWNSDVESARAKGLDGLIQLTNQSHADGQGGAVQSKAVYSPDGKTFTIVKLMPDGTTQQAMPAMPNTPESVDQLAMMLVKGVPPQARLAHYVQVRESERKAENDKMDAEYKMGMLGVAKQKAGAEEAYQSGMLGVARQNADTNAGYRRDAGMAALTRADKAGGGKASAFERMDEADKMALGNINKRMEQINSAVTKAQAEGSWDPASPGAQALQQQQRVLSVQAQTLVQKYTGTDDRPDPLDVRKGKPEAPKAEAKASKPAPPVVPAEKKPEEPGIGSKVVDAVKQGAGALASALGGARQTGAEYEAIQKRVREAGSGGPPLTAEEKAKARSFGIATGR